MNFQEEGTIDDSNSKKSKENEKSIEPPKDYIHVRARRGQATDSHSLAERVSKLLSFFKILGLMRCVNLCLIVIG